MDWRMHSLILPSTYTGGLISAALYKRIRDVRGTFFQSQIPDVYSGLAICSAVDEYLFAFEPFAIQGASRHSNGAALFRMDRTAFLDEGNIPFHPDIPLPEFGTLTFSLPAMVYECYLQSRYLHGDVADVKPEDMLQLILSETPIGKDILRDWSHEFATRHGVDRSAVLRKSKRSLFRRRLSAARAKLDNVITRYRIDRSHNLPVRDVFEASIVAEAILRLRPNVVTNYPRAIRRLAARRLTGDAPRATQLS